MGKKDVTSIEYFENPARFADVINGYVLSGQQLVLPEDVHIHEKNKSSMMEGNNAKALTVIRDVVRHVDIEMNTTIISLENQTDVHYAMPLRVMADDVTAYHEQWRKISDQHHINKDLNSKEYLSGIKKGEKLIPASTIVVYFGQEAWDGPCSLKEMLNTEALPPEVQAFVADYPMHILDIRRYEGYDLFQTDLKEVCGFFRHDQDADELKDYISERKEAFSNMAPDAVRLISEFSHSKQLLKQMKQDIYHTDEGGMNMCKAIDDLINRGMEIGTERGIEIGTERGIEIGTERGIEIGTERGIEIGITRSIENIISKLYKLNAAKDYIVDVIMDSFSLTPEQADFYMQKYR